MARVTRKVLIRLDRDAVEVSGLRRRTPVQERYDVEHGGDPYAVLESALATSRLLRPGRPCEVGIHFESPHTLYHPPSGDGDDPSANDAVTVIMPEVVREVLEPILARRRVHGGAWFAAGPAHRAYSTLKDRLSAGVMGRGFIVDRSSAAVTVLLVEDAVIRWARGVPGDDPVEAASVLLRRAAEVVNGAYGLHWWHLEDVASPSCERRRRREAREFEARCDALIGHLPRMAGQVR